VLKFKLLNPNIQSHLRGTIELRQAETLEQTKKLEIQKKIRLNKADNHLVSITSLIYGLIMKKNPKGHNVQDGWFGDTCRYFLPDTYLRDTVEGDCALGRK
jgi:hypothetical protein